MVKPFCVSASRMWLLRNDNDFNLRYPGIVCRLAALPDETVLDGEVVAPGEAGRPSFNALQNFGAATVLYYVFDVLILAGQDVMSQPLTFRRDLLERDVLPRLSEPVRRSPGLDAILPDLIEAVRAQGLEGLVAKRLYRRYEPDQRSAAWQKMRVKSRPGVCNRRVHIGAPLLRCTDLRLLQR